MLDPEDVEGFVGDSSSGDFGLSSPVAKVENFFEKAEKSVEKSNTNVASMVGRLTCWNRGKRGVVEEQRTVRLNDDGANKHFATNFVSTAKYHMHNFLFKFLYEQFVLRIANSYFLFVGILYCFDAISPVKTFSRYGQLIAIAFIIFVSLVKETIEDYRRHREDRRINQLVTEVIGPRGKVKWGKVRVGEVLRVNKDEAFPADLVLLHAESDDGLAFVETKQLDGESNLKVKACLHEVSKFFETEEMVLKAEGFVESEPPNHNLQEYFGSITLVSESAHEKVAKTWPLNIDNMLVRGCRLRQTSFIYGLVVNTGRDTKLLRNIKPKPKKVSTTESKVNFLLLFPVFLQITYITTLTIMNAVNCKKTLSYWYLMPDEACTTFNAFLRFFTFFCTFSNLIPISLYVSIEIIRGFQVYFMAMDDEIMDTDRAEPMRLNVRTSNLTDELGILTHLFSDKTGTLTANDMVFKKCYVVGTVFEEVKAGESPTAGAQSTDVLRESMRRAHKKNSDSEGTAKDIQSVDTMREFHYLLAMCQTTVPDGDEYQAASPDEAALVMEAKVNGFRFVQRTNKAITLRVFEDEEEWELLSMIEFTSTRKRMSVVVRSPHDGKLMVYCKGADTMIFERIDPNQDGDIAKTKKILDEFACDGLRTLCLGSKTISEEAYVNWSAKWAKAMMSPDREELCAQLSEEIEGNLTLLGCTAIEDRLQDGVPETLKDMEKANIKVWVLTGDKQETAINIGLSCGLLHENMDVVVVNESSEEDTEAQLDKAFGRWQFMMADGKDSSHFGIVVDGGTLEFVLENPRLEKKLVSLGKIAKSVITCRVSPKQKSDVVEMVRKNETSAITVAVGDGANDVGMIQAAHVGVGIVGVEGLEAKLASDFAIGQFRFLRRLILVHGRWCYKRMCRVICYMVYKNILLLTPDFYFAFSTAFSGQPLTDPWITALYNVVLTSLPIIAVGSYDSDVASNYALKFPEIYRRSQDRTALRITVFLKWVLSGLWQASAIFWISRAVVGDNLVFASGLLGGLYSYGVVIFTQVVIVAHASLMVYQSSWTGLTLFITIFSLCTWFAIGPLMSSTLLAVDLAVTPNLFGVVQKVFSLSYFWLLAFLSVVICILPGQAAKYYERNYRPTTKTLVQELMRRKCTREEVMGQEKEPNNNIMPTFTRRDLAFDVKGFAFDSLLKITSTNDVSYSLSTTRRLSEPGPEKETLVSTNPRKERGKGHRRVRSDDK